MSNGNRYFDFKELHICILRKLYYSFIIMSNFIINFWYGRIPLWKSYWLIGELINSLVLLLIYNIFYIHGGPIQKVVLNKTGTRYARSATIINTIYALVLYYFKELNNLPMSTTWVFVGLLCGRELAIATMKKEYKLKYVFPLIGKDFIKMIFGLSVSVGIVLAIHYIIIPNNYGI